MDFLAQLFKDTSHSFRDVYAAMDTNDEAMIVKAASKALQLYNFKSNVLMKSVDTSNEARAKGNVYYKNSELTKALKCYNEALCLAPNNSEQQMLACSNRSAVLFAIRYFSGCAADIMTCKTMGCPETLTKRLDKRLNDSKKYMHEQLYIEMRSSDNFIASFFNEFNSCKKNESVPCVIADVSISSKSITAKRDITVGRVVAVEKAFVSASPNIHASCYYCHQVSIQLYSCKGCCLAMFCSEECMSLCLKEYHKIECQIISFVWFLYDKLCVRLTTRSAIKLSLEMGWDKFIVASKNIGASRLETGSVREIYNSDEPLSMLSYNDNKELTEGRIFNGSIYSATILHFLQLLPNYFPKGAVKRSEAVDAMARTMLHLYATYTNAIPIESSAFDYNSKVNKGGVQTNYGWFSMASKLKHSCEPNLFVVGLNNKIALLALKTIKKGEDLTISYIEHVYDTPRTFIRNFRSTTLFRATRHMCTCRVCVRQWNRHTETAYTSRRGDTHRWMQLEACQSTEKQYTILGEFLNQFPWMTTQHKLAYSVFKRTITFLQCQHTNNIIYLDEDGDRNNLYDA